VLRGAGGPGPCVLCVACAPCTSGQKVQQARTRHAHGTHRIHAASRPRGARCVSVSAHAPQQRVAVCDGAVEGCVCHGYRAAGSERRNLVAAWPHGHLIPHGVRALAAVAAEGLQCSVWLRWRWRVRVRVSVGSMCSGCGSRHWLSDQQAAPRPRHRHRRMHPPHTHTPTKTHLHVADVLRGVHQAQLGDARWPRAQLRHAVDHASDVQKVVHAALGLHILKVHRGLQAGQGVLCLVQGPASGQARAGPCGAGCALDPPGVLRESVHHTCVPWPLLLTCTDPGLCHINSSSNR
jgi:hypothetical protein